MKLKYNDTTYDLIAPASYSDLIFLISSKFHLSNISALIKTTEGIYPVSSTPEYESIPHTSILEIEVCPPRDPLLLNLNYSIDTCTSHEQSDSDESKKSEILNTSVSLSQTKATELIPENRTQLTQTDSIDYSETFVNNVVDTKEFQAQYDEPLVIEIEVLEQFFKKFLMETRKVVKKNTFVHNGFFCSCCRTTPIVGVRFECLECKKQLCEKCESKEEHPHDLLVHKGMTKTVQSLSKEETVIKKIVDMGLGDRERVRMVGKKYQFDLDKTVEELLFN